MNSRWSTLVVLLALGLAVAAQAAEISVQPPVFTKARATHVTSPDRPGGSALDETIYYEDWEDGDFAGWTPIDNTAIPSTWHLDAQDAFGGAGTSWWVGDPDISTNGGYLSDWYMTLDTPPVVLPAGTPTLRFWHRYSVEQPGGEPAGYNAWDGVNIRISTDNGGTWTVIPSTALTPAYDATSLYSFGFQHNEGPGIPGWVGINNGRNWHLQTANLTAWAGQTVKIRFAFASDPEWDTTSPGGSTAFGWMLDNIRVHNGADTVFTNNGDDNTGWVATNRRPSGGNLWRIATDNLSPDGQHIIVCNNASNNQYNADMNTVFESPYIDVSDRTGGQLIADIQVTGSLPGCTQEQFENGQCDYWGIEVSIDSGASWCAVSNPTCAPPPAQNFVYIDAPETWASFNESYANPMDFSALIGEVIKVRLTFQSDPGTVLDMGPKFDGFEMEYTAGFPNDISCYSLQVRYPNVAGRPNRIKAYFKNMGSATQNNVNAFYNRSGAANWFAFLPIPSMAPNDLASRDTVITINAAGNYDFRARAALAGDQNLANDTSYAEGVAVLAADPNGTMEFGYDNRTTQYRFNYTTNNGPLIHYTPISDGELAAPYAVDALAMVFDPTQTANAQIRVKVYHGGQVPLEANLIYNELVTVSTDEVAPNWKIIDVSDDPDFQDMTEDFWVFLQIVDTAPGDRFPQIIGDDEQPWDDVHFYVWNGTGNPSVSNYFYIVHALLTPGSAVRDVTTTVPTEWALEQNYPNPFNPSTVIRFSVPKAELMTLKVYNLMGQEVATLVNGVTQPGSYSVDFNGLNLSSGVYVYRLESESFSASNKMLLMK